MFSMARVGPPMVYYVQKVIGSLCFMFEGLHRAKKATPITSAADDCMRICVIKRYPKDVYAICMMVQPIGAGIIQQECVRYIYSIRGNPLNQDNG